MSFFQFFHEKPLLSCLYQVKKTSIVTKLQNIMGQKSQQDILFFKNVYFLKTTVLSFAYFVQKMSILLTTEDSHVMCSIFFFKSLYFYAHIWSKNVNSLRATLFMGQQSQQMPVFLIFHEKINAFMHIFCKNTSIL